MGRIASSLRRDHFTSKPDTKGDVPYSGFVFLFDLFVIVIVGLSEASNYVVDLEDLCVARKWKRRLEILPHALHELVCQDRWSSLCVTFAEWFLELLKSDSVPSEHKLCIRNSATALKVLDNYKEGHIWGQLVLNC